MINEQDKKKTKEQLISELSVLRRKVIDLERKERERAAESETAINFLKEEIEIRREAEKTLKENETKIRLFHRMKVIGEIASGVAHEVRNPLHALMSVTEALKLELTDNPDVEIYLFHIHEQVNRLSALMKDLLELGKPVEPSRLRRELLGELCYDGINLWKSSPAGRECDVSLVLPPEQRHIYVHVDNQRIQQVFLNLFDNAAHHSPKGGDIRVIVKSPVGNAVKVCVVDRGSAVPEECMSRIFEPFFSSRRGGTGLGLNIIRNIMESHGGHLALRNNDPPPGCTAELVLPLSEDGTA